MSGGLLSLGRAGHIERLFEAAGFRETSTFQIEAPFGLPSVDVYIDFLRTAAAPVMALLLRLEPAAREEAWRDTRDQLSDFSGPDGWVGPNTLIVTAGRK